jgi:hypothetical protein
VWRSAALALASTLLSPAATQGRLEGDCFVLQKRMFKVISPIERKDGSTYWMRVGTGFANKDDSINIYLDAMPKDMKLQLRELTEEELREREGRRSDVGARRTNGTPSASAPLASQDQIPF